MCWQEFFFHNQCSHKPYEKVSVGISGYITRWCQREIFWVVTWVNTARTSHLYSHLSRIWNHMKNLPLQLSYKGQSCSWFFFNGPKIRSLSGWLLSRNQTTMLSVVFKLPTIFAVHKMPEIFWLDNGYNSSVHKDFKLNHHRLYCV